MQTAKQYDLLSELENRKRENKKSRRKLRREIRALKRANIQSQEKGRINYHA